MLLCITRKTDMTTHLQNVHGMKRGLKCKFCEKTFSRKSLMKIHVKNFQEMKRDFKCDSCHKTFTQKETLLNHIQTIHESDLERHILKFHKNKEVPT